MLALTQAPTAGEISGNVQCRRMLGVTTVVWIISPYVVEDCSDGDDGDDYDDGDDMMCDDDDDDDDDRCGDDDDDGDDGIDDCD